MPRIVLEAVGLEFEENGNTIWVHGPQGTLLRIKCTGRIQVNRCEAPGAHADAIVAGNIEFCVPPSEVPGAGRLAKRALSVERLLGAAKARSLGVAVGGRRASRVARALARGTGRP